MNNESSMQWNINYWLKKNGILIITTPYHGYLKNFLIALFNGFDKHANPLDICGHIRFFSKKTISILLEQNGFKVLDFLGAGRMPYLWKSMIIIARKK